MRTMILPFRAIPVISAKGNKLLTEWLNPDYCKERNINFETVSTVIKDILI